MYQTTKPIQCCPNAKSAERLDRYNIGHQTQQGVCPNGSWESADTNTLLDDLLGGADLLLGAGFQPDALPDLCASEVSIC